MPTTTESKLTGIWSMDHKIRTLTEFRDSAYADPKNNQGRPHYVQLGLPRCGDHDPDHLKVWPEIRLEIPNRDDNEWWIHSWDIIHSLACHRYEVNRNEMIVKVLAVFYHPGYDNRGGHCPQVLNNWGVTRDEAWDNYKNIEGHAAKAAGMTQDRWEDIAYGVSEKNWQHV